MDGFERAFARTEDAAAAAVKSAADLGKLAKQLEKAAKEGNIGAVKRVSERFDAALRDVEQAANSAAQSWALTDAEEQQHLRDGYASELQRVASEQGLNIYERDGRLIASPSIVRILPADKAVRIDRKQSSTLRPSALVGLLVANQNKPSKYRSDRFLESLHEVYRELIREDSSDRMLKVPVGRVIPLLRVYNMLTSLPGAALEYTRTDFARDLYLLDTSGLTKTRNGATASFHVSTGARARGNELFTFVDADGRDAQYYGIRFSEAS